MFNTPERLFQQLNVYIENAQYGYMIGFILTLPPIFTEAFNPLHYIENRSFECWLSDKFYAEVINYMLNAL